MGLVAASSSWHHMFACVDSVCLGRQTGHHKPASIQEWALTGSRMLSHSAKLCIAGVAHTFFSGLSDKPRAGELINVLREAGQVVPPELSKFGTTVKKKESKLYGAHFKDVDFTAKASKTTFDSDDE